MGRTLSLLLLGPEMMYYVGLGKKKKNVIL
jgi:hypothetical protein